jgi:hypothetical protein
MNNGKAPGLDSIMNERMQRFCATFRIQIYIKIPNNQKPAKFSLLKYLQQLPYDSLKLF